MQPTEKQVEAAARAFLLYVRPSAALRDVEQLNHIDLDDSDLPILDAMRNALIAALALTQQVVTNEKI